MSTREIIHAPLAGWSAPLAEIPDAAFAQRLLGDGAAIDPLSGELRAPCDGEVISIAASRHAVALRTNAGAELLLHVGIDTVGLAGEGFEAHVRKGERVRRGDLLLRFDLDRVARRAPSLITPIIVTNGDRFRIVHARANRAVDIGDELFELEATGAAAEAPPATAGTPVVSESLVVDHAHGIHARPAAMIARLAKTLPHEIGIRARGRAASARSAVALMSLGVRGGDEVVIAGFEPAAASSVAALARVIRDLEKGDRSIFPASAAEGPTEIAPGHLRGVVASRGFAVGPACRLQRPETPVPENGRGADAESAALDRALAAMRERLTSLQATASGALREIVGAHLELLDDPELTREAHRRLATGQSAAFAWRVTLRASAAALEATGETLLAERVDDLRDLEDQVLVALGAIPASKPDVPAGGILVARDLAPSQFIELDATKLGGIALAAGGPTSHVAILAAAAGVPMLVALGPRALEARSGTPLILDADAGSLRVAPDTAELDAARARVADRRAARERERAAAQRDCHLASGERIEVFANLSGTVADAELAVAQGAEGCGLLRTEFLFLDRATAPDEDEQLRSYDAVARVLAGRPLIIRTMDIGGDKPIPYLPLPPEENPALGLRGVRTSFRRPDLFEAQLRALLRVTPAGQCRILLPMITDAAELRAVRELLEKLRSPLGAPMPQLGAMIETPAAALRADAIAREADFLSIGTNDLTQYTLAMDRGHAELAPRIDGLHPAVLALIERAGRAGGRYDKPVAVCGGLASDPVAAPILLGLGVRELSVVPTLIPTLKATLSALTLDACRDLARQALALESAADVRRLAAGGAP